MFKQYKSQKDKINSLLKENIMNKKAKSLPKLNKVQLIHKTQNLAKLLSKQSPQPNQDQHKLITIQQAIDPQQSHKHKVNEILLKSKSMIDKNKDKIQIAKRFRILKKKSAGPFLTGVDIYKEQDEQKPRYNYVAKQTQSESNQEELKKLLSEKYDDLAELRKMIKKTSKNLGAYKQQTLSIQKNLINMADKYGDVAIDVLSRKKLNSNIYDYKDQI